MTTNKPCDRVIASQYLKENPSGRRDTTKLPDHVFSEFCGVGILSRSTDGTWYSLTRFGEEQINSILRLQELKAEADRLVELAKKHAIA